MSRASLTKQIPGAGASSGLDRRTSTIATTSSATPTQRSFWCSLGGDSFPRPSHLLSVANSSRRQTARAHQALELNSESLKVCLPLVCLGGFGGPGRVGGRQMRAARGPANHPRQRCGIMCGQATETDSSKTAGIPILKKAGRKQFWPALFGLERWYLRNLADVHVKSGEGSRHSISTTFWSKRFKPEDSDSRIASSRVVSGIDRAVDAKRPRRSWRFQKKCLGTSSRWRSRLPRCA